MLVYPAGDNVFVLLVRLWCTSMASRPNGGGASFQIHRSGVHVDEHLRNILRRFRLGPKDFGQPVL